MIDAPFVICAFLPFYLCQSIVCLHQWPLIYYNGLHTVFCQNVVPPHSDNLSLCPLSGTLLSVCHSLSSSLCLSLSLYMYLSRSCSLHASLYICRCRSLPYLSEFYNIPLALYVSRSVCVIVYASACFYMSIWINRRQSNCVGFRRLSINSPALNSALIYQKRF